LGQESEYNALRTAKKTNTKFIFIAILFEGFCTRLGASSQVSPAYPQFKKISTIRAEKLTTDVRNIFGEKIWHLQK
jgi:hypothetical protein